MGIAPVRSSCGGRYSSERAECFESRSVQPADGAGWRKWLRLVEGGAAEDARLRRCIP
jgi:hypothetical protein